MSDKEAATYVSPKAPGFKTRIEVEGKDVNIQFERGALTLTDPKVIAEFDRIIETVPSVAQMVSKVNRDAAARMVAEHQKQTQAAIKGGTDTSQLARMHKQEIPGSTKTLGEVAPNNPEALQTFQRELGGDDIAITEQVGTEETVQETPDAPVATENVSPSEQPAKPVNLLKSAG